MPSGPRLRQGGAHGQDVRRHRVLPLRPRRRDRRRHRARARDGGPLHAAQGQGGGRRLPAQLLRGLRQGHRPRRRRGRLGGLRRRRRRRAPCARATCWRRSTTQRRGDARRAGLPAALPRARRAPRAHLRLPRARRASRPCGRPCSTPSSRPSCSSASRSPRPPCDPDPWRERQRPVHPKQFAELDSEPSWTSSPPRRPAMSAASRRVDAGAADVPLLEGRSVERRRPADRGLPAARRLGGDRRRLPAPRRAAAATASSPTAASPARCTAAASTCAPAGSRAATTRRRARGRRA